MMLKLVRELVGCATLSAAIATRASVLLLRKDHNVEGKGQVEVQVDFIGNMHGCLRRNKRHSS